MGIKHPTPGRVVLYRTDGRNGLVYDLPAMVTVTAASHPGDYPDGSRNPLGQPHAANVVHLTVLTVGGFGTEPIPAQVPHGDDRDFVGATSFTPGSGTYVEYDVPHAGPGLDGISADVDDPRHDEVPPRTWRWPLATP